MKTSKDIGTLSPISPQGLGIDMEEERGGRKSVRTRCGGWLQGNSIFQTQWGWYTHELTETSTNSSQTSPDLEGFSFQPPSADLGLECFSPWNLLLNKLNLSTSFWTLPGWFNSAVLAQTESNWPHSQPLLNCSAWPQTNSSNLLYSLTPYSFSGFSCLCWPALKWKPSTKCHSITAATGLQLNYTSMYFSQFKAFDIYNRSLESRPWNYQGVILVLENPNNSSLKTILVSIYAYNFLNYKCLQSSHM